MAAEAVVTSVLSTRTLIQYVVQPASQSYCFIFSSLPLSFPIWTKEINYRVLSSRCSFRRPGHLRCAVLFFVTKWKENSYIEICIDLWLCDATADAKIMRRKMRKVSLSNRKCWYNKEFSFIPYCSVLIVLFPN